MELDCMQEKHIELAKGILYDKIRDYLYFSKKLTRYKSENINSIKKKKEYILNMKCLIALEQITKKATHLKQEEINDYTKEEMLDILNIVNNLFTKGIKDVQKNNSFSSPFIKRKKKETIDKYNEIINVLNIIILNYEKQKE